MQALNQVPQADREVFRFILARDVEAGSMDKERRNIETAGRIF